MPAAGSAQITEIDFEVVKKIKWEWTTGTAGTVLADCTSTSFYTGKILFFVTIPGTSGAAPTDNYDVTILDADDVDVLADAGLDRATGTTESVCTGSLGAVVASELELNVQNAGSANTGICYLFIR